MRYSIEHLDPALLLGRLQSIPAWRFFLRTGALLLFVVAVLWALSWRFPADLSASQEGFVLPSPLLTRMHGALPGDALRGRRVPLPTPDTDR